MPDINQIDIKDTIYDLQDKRLNSTQSVSTIGIDTIATDNSNNLITSNAVYNHIKVQGSILVIGGIE